MATVVLRCLCCDDIAEYRGHSCYFEKCSWPLWFEDANALTRIVGFVFGPCYCKEFWPWCFKVSLVH